MKSFIFFKYIGYPVERITGLHHSLHQGNGFKASQIAFTSRKLPQDAGNIFSKIIHLFYNLIPSLNKNKFDLNKRCL